MRGYLPDFTVSDQQLFYERFLSSVSSGESSVLKQQLTPPPSPAATTITSTANVTIVSLPRTAQTRLPMAATSVPVESPCHRLPDAYNTLPISPVSPNTPNPYSSGKPVGKPGSLGSLSVSAPSQQVFERIRELIPNVPTDNNAYRILVQTATSVIELEHKLQNIIQEKEKYKTLLESRSRQTATALCNTAVSSAEGALPCSTPGAVQCGLSINQTNCRIANIQSPVYPSNPILSASVPTRLDSPLPNGPNHTVRPPWGDSQIPASCAVSIPDDLFHVDVSAFKHLVTSPTTTMENSFFGSGKGPTVGHGNFAEFFPGNFSFDMDPLTVDTA